MLSPNLYPSLCTVSRNYNPLYQQPRSFTLTSALPVSNVSVVLPHHSINLQTQKGAINTIKQLQQRYDVEIDYNSEKIYPYKVNGKSLDQAFQFKSLTELERALEHGYLRRKAKMFARVKRWVTGRDVHNVKTMRKDEKAGAAIVIDGGDDVAVSLENTGLSKQVVYTLQASTLYPLFMSVVYIGWKGANEEEAKATEEYQQLQENIKTLRQELINELLEAMAQEAALKEKAIKDSDSLADAEFLHALNEDAKFKTALIKRAAKLFKQDNWSQSSAFGSKKAELRALLKELKSHNCSENPNVVSQHIHTTKAIYTPECSNLFDPRRQECQDFLTRLAEYQDALDARLGSFCEANIAAPFTQSGLSSMFWGMGAYQARALAELFTGEGNAVSAVISNVGDYYSLIGQAQMVLAGLFKTGASIHEAKSVSDWIKAIEKSNVLSSDEFRAVKGILKDFNQRKRNLAITDAVGSGLLTAGQLGMILGGPLALGLSPVLFAGVGATVAGVVISQVASQYADKALEIGEEKSKKEQEIANFTNSDKDPFENIEHRIHQLFNLSIENAKPKVLTDIYCYIINNPKKEVANVLKHFEKKYRKYASDDADHYRHLYYKGFTKLLAQKETRHKLNAARALLIDGDTGGFSKAMAWHISVFKPAHQENIFHDILSLLDFAKNQGIELDLYRRMTKRLINTNGYLCHKEQKQAHQRYLLEIDARKNKRSWRIPNPLSPINAIYKAGKGIYRYIKKTEVEHETPSRGSHFKINWGSKKTTVYLFDREKFRNDLLTLDPASADGKALLELCHAMFTEKLVSEVKDWLGIDRRNVFTENIRHVYRRMQRDDVLRPVVFGIGEQVALAQQLEALLFLREKRQNLPDLNDNYEVWHTRL